METDARLSDVLSEFARTLVTDFPIQGILDHLVRRIVDILPIDAAGVSLISPTPHPRFIAGSDESAVRYEQLQTDAWTRGRAWRRTRPTRPISIPDLADDDRFPRFAEQALADGLVAVFTFPLRNGDRTPGRPRPLPRRRRVRSTTQEMAVAQTLADVATAYLLNAQARQAKTEFVATVSHELRTPMTSIPASSSCCRTTTAGTLTADQAEFVDAIRRNSDRLTALANDLLTLSSLEAGTFVHEQVNVDLGRGAVGRAERAGARHRSPALDVDLRCTRRARDGAR